MTLADNALTTVERLKQFNGIAEADASQDFKLGFLIDSASQEIENVLGRKLKKSQYTEKVKGNNRLTIQVKNYPLLEVDSIKINGSLVNESDYAYDESGIIEGIRPWGASGLHYGISNFMVQQSKNIEIAYTAGYVLPKDETEEESRTLPYDIEAALFSMINGAMALTDGAAGLKSFAISDVRWEWDKDYMRSILPSLMQHRAVRV
ncbi:hypothetical protein LNN31_13615 [Acetobacterium wieringae]|uniref:Phage gp6-like head-tail connector protein n=1 Tax=Acetobacterium wieringae TaxID=52694 RepID=A0ABY6HBD1_9FIRM|nr:hypothetical protein [Acetobacterium wieringae]UYO61814.1 hypothetical protein LNN31_13615 [Acetobacterium wieringae]